MESIGTLLLCCYGSTRRWMLLTFTAEVKVLPLTWPTRTFISAAGYHSILLIDSKNSLCWISCRNLWFGLMKERRQHIVFLYVYYSSYVCNEIDKQTQREFFVSLTVKVTTLGGWRWRSVDRRHLEIRQAGWKGGWQTGRSAGAGWFRLSRNKEVTEAGVQENVLYC